MERRAQVASDDLRVRKLSGVIVPLLHIRHRICDTRQPGGVRLCGRWRYPGSWGYMAGRAPFDHRSARNSRWTSQVRSQVFRFRLEVTFIEGLNYLTVTSKPTWVPSKDLEGAYDILVTMKPASYSTGATRIKTITSICFPRISYWYSDTITVGTTSSQIDLFRWTTELAKTGAADGSTGLALNTITYAYALQLPGYLEFDFWFIQLRVYRNSLMRLSFVTYTQADWTANQQTRPISGCYISFSSESARVRDHVANGLNARGGGILYLTWRPAHSSYCPLLEPLMGSSFGSVYLLWVQWAVPRWITGLTKFSFRYLLWCVSGEEVRHQIMLQMGDVMLVHWSCYSLR